MFCKNCGKRLPDDARFCDRCNTSVRKKGGKADRIKKLKEERIARNKANTIETRLKNIKKIRRRKYQYGIGVAVLVVVLGALSIYGSYIFNSRDNKVIGEEEFQTQTPPPTEMPTQTGEPEGVENSDGYIEVSVANASFAYPAEFKATKNPEGKVMLVKDESGGGVIVLSKEVTSLDAKGLMEKYRNGIENAKAKESLASNTGYSITVETHDMIYHKKSYVSDGTELFYELSYPINSAKALDYEAYIDYMDEHFTAS